ncbi:MAG TPA: hypothetical protein VFV38_08495 [Ktedonobacteraceae bacterium]|nr:hypothetical protein [Ktedonobacteraceae bacterium]
MDPMSYQEAFRVLRLAGFGEGAIARLYQLRRDYLKNECDQPPLDQSRLEFVRWLVTTGRLTDSLPEEEPKGEMPHMTGWAQFKRLFLRFWWGEARASS